MKQKIQIAIPEPCHKGWQNMSPVDKGRFCASCQKTVLDFSLLSDNEIIKLVSKEDNLCGRFSTSQLNRNLIETQRKSNYFGYLATSVLAFLGLGTVSIVAQEKPVVEQTDLKYLNKLSDSVKKFPIKGKVFLENKTLSKVSILNKTSNFETETDENGMYNILVSNGDVLIFSYLGLLSQERIIKENKLMNVNMKHSDNEVKMEYCVTGFIKKRTFFGRTFHKIGNWFR